MYPKVKRGRTSKYTYIRLLNGSYKSNCFFFQTVHVLKKRERERERESQREGVEIECKLAKEKDKIKINYKELF